MAEHASWLRPNAGLPSMHGNADVTDVARVDSRSRVFANLGSSSPLLSFWDEELHYAIPGTNNLTGTLVYYDTKPFQGQLIVNLNLTAVLRTSNKIIHRKFYRTSAICIIL